LASFIIFINAAMQPRNSKETDFSAPRLVIKKNEAKRVEKTCAFSKATNGNYLLWRDFR
jgi:hypothetical protein